MNWLTIALIVFICLWVYERGRLTRLRKHNRQLEDRLSNLEGAGQPAAGDDRDQSDIDTAELNELRERVQVLERIATDENSSEARKAQRIAREIESLRGDIARRSSRTTEDIEE
ncbi:hypothetical protein [Erythrobacter sp. MTPC3]|uniref:hypothetical protein n=1 Tax=Erythrobacter sp. MTPC3 TaxID=3056564 RepID=UPI0036F360CD